MALVVLVGVAGALLAVAGVGRVAPGRVGVMRAGVCLVGVAAALLSGPGDLLGGRLALDGVSAVSLVALLVLGACGAAGPLMLGVLALGLMAGDLLGFCVCFGAAAVLAVRGDRRVLLGGIVCLLGAMMVLGWPGDLGFAVIRGRTPGAGAAVLPMLVAGAAVLLGPALGGVAAVYVVARLLLDLAGPGTPGWWGVPVLAGGMGVAVAMARRAAAAADLGVAVRAMGDAVAGLAVAGLGVALLARRADLLPLVSMGVAASLLLVLAWGVWGGLLLLAGGAIQVSAGTSLLGRMGGLLRRMPMTGLALLIGLASAAALPLTPGFAAVWLLLQGLLAAARSGGTAVLALVAAGVAAAGLVLALLGAAALRMGGLALLGAPRSARAGSAPDAAGGARLGMAVLGVVAMATGVVPWLAMLVVQPGVRVLAGVGLEGVGVWSLASVAESGGAEGGGYAAPGVALLVGGCAGVAAWAGRGARQVVQGWRGGLGEDGVVPGFALVLWPGWRRWRPAVTGRMMLGGLGLVLAVAVGWAAR